jgi:hypothetical protein
MSLHPIREEIKQYLFSPGLICHRKVNPNEQNPTTASEDPTGNGVLYTALYYVTLAKLGVLTDEDKWRFREVIRQCYSPGNTGLIQRSPRKPDQEGPDDYVGAVAVDKLVAIDVLSYGQNNKAKLFKFISIPYVYNTEHPGIYRLKAHLGRQAQLIAHFKACAGSPAGFVTTIWWAIVITIGAFKDKTDNDGWLLSWLLTENCPDHFLCKWAKNFWRIKARETFGDQVQGIAARCLDSDHPIGKYFVF